MIFRTVKKRLELLYFLKKLCKNWIHVLLCVYGLKNPKKIIYVLKDGTKFSIHKHPVDLEAITENWAPEWGRGYFSEFGEIRPQKIVIDIGTHIGTFAVYIAKRNPQVKVYAYEPDPSNYELLCENLELNSLHNIFPKNMAVGNRKKKVNLFAKKGRKFGTMGSSIVMKGDTTITVPCISLLDILNENKISRCDLLKIDCEGAEYEILLSQGNECYSHIESIILEFHHVKDLSYDQNDLINHLKKFGFLVKTSRSKDDKSGFLFARRP